MKYIDSDKLIAEIERRIINGQDGYGGNLKALLPFITSLQQEQPEVDLEKEIDDKGAVVWKKAKKGFKCGENDFVFTLDKDGKMSPYWDTEVEEGQYYLTEQDIENLPKE